MAKPPGPKLEKKGCKLNTSQFWIPGAKAPGLNLKNKMSAMDPKKKQDGILPPRGLVVGI